MLRSELGNGAMATGLASGLGAMAPALSGARVGLVQFKAAVINATTNTRTSLADSRKAIKALTQGDTTLQNTQSMYMDKSGLAYPDGKSCMSLACIDSTWDLIDNGEPYEEGGSSLTDGHSRTAIFTALSFIASVGSALGIAGVVLDKTLFWKLTALIFIVWGPLSLLVCALVTPIYILLSDLCQDVEEVAAQVAGASVPPSSSAIVLLKGSTINSALDAMPGINVTTTVDDLMVDNIQSAMLYYLHGCQGSASSIDKGLNQIKVVLTEVIEGVGGTAANTINEMTNQMPANLTIRQSFTDEIVKIVTVATNKNTGIIPVINKGVSLVQCERVSAVSLLMRILLPSTSYSLRPRQA